MRADLSAETAAGLLSALSTLAASVKPVSAESLRACAHPKQANVVIRNYTIVALILGALVLVFSMWSFVGSSISDSIRKYTETGNELALQLVGEVQSVRSSTGVLEGAPFPPAPGVHITAFITGAAPSATSVIEGPPTWPARSAAATVTAVSAVMPSSDGPGGSVR